MTRAEHDTAFALTGALLAIITPCLNEAEVAECGRVFYALIGRALVTHAERAARERSRLTKPGSDAPPDEPGE